MICSHIRRAGTACRNITTLVAVMLMSACATVPPEQDPVVLKLTELEERLIRVERVVNNQSLLDLLSQVQQLQEESRLLRGEIETLSFELNGTREQQRNIYADLDGRIAAVEQGTASLGRVTPGTTDPATGEEIAGAPAESDREAYQRAFTLLQERRYQEAAAQFSAFIQSYPESGLTDNAYYWLGEAYYVTRDFKTALSHFNTVVSDYPQSRKMPDAMLKIGYCHYELKQWKSAKDVLVRVVADFPDTTSARLAQQRLDQLSAEGR